MKYKLYTILTKWRDKTYEPITSILDFIRYEWLYDIKDKRHHYD